MMPFVVKGTPISAPQTGLWQQSSKSFVLRDCDHLFFTFTSALSTGQRNDFSNILAGVAKPKVLRGR